MFHADRDIVLIGRGAQADLVLEENFVAARHAQLVISQSEVNVLNLSGRAASRVLRGDEVIELGETSVELLARDRLELGMAAGPTVVLNVLIGAEDEPAHVVDLRSLADVVGAHTSRQDAALKELLTVQSRIGEADDLDGVLCRVADAALDLVPRATHVTLVLRDETTKTDKLGSYVPVLTRVRGNDGRGTTPSSPVQITRSVFRKVVEERAFVLAADTENAGLASESFLGASIMSTIGVPLFKGEKIVGVIQVDARESQAPFDSTDVDALGVLAANASLAVANARLISQLESAERRLTAEVNFLKGARRAPPAIIGESPPMIRLSEQLKKVSPTRVSVLIEGETGTGKELVAAALHHGSPRANRLFVAQNCAALPANLLESELFGHIRGAFTGARDDKRGLFEVADGGSLFLDEIAELPLELQGKLLRVLQEGEVRPLGATASKQVDVRIIAACNIDLEARVREGKFREDLLYRLKVFPLAVPPLRERQEDIPRLIRHFLKHYAIEFGFPEARLAQNTLDLLTDYRWPGNVRQLQNEVQRLLIEAEPGAIVVPDMLSPDIQRTNGLVEKARRKRGSLKQMVEEVERHLVSECLREHDGNKTATAKTLGITREGLHKKLKLLGLS